MSEWKTIDSAPKDGTEILGWFPDLNSCCQITHFSESEYRENGKVTYQHSYWYVSNLFRMGGPDPEPTHWMPIPESPNLPETSNGNA